MEEKPYPDMTDIQALDKLLSLSLDLLETDKEKGDSLYQIQEYLKGRLSGNGKLDGTRIFDVLNYTKWTRDRLELINLCYGAGANIEYPSAFLDAIGGLVDDCLQDLNFIIEGIERTFDFSPERFERRIEELKRKDRIAEQGQP